MISTPIPLCVEHHCTILFVLSTALVYSITILSGFEDFCACGDDHDDDPHRGDQSRRHHHRALWAFLNSIPSHPKTEVTNTLTETSNVTTSNVDSINMASSSPPSLPSSWRQAVEQNLPDQLQSFILSSSKEQRQRQQEYLQDALQLACEWGHAECVRVLCQAGAKLNLEDDDNNTMDNNNNNTTLTNVSSPLHTTIRSPKTKAKQKLEVTEVLLEYGADLAQRDETGHVPLDYCLQSLGDAAATPTPAETVIPEGHALVRKLQPPEPPLLQAADDMDVRRIRTILETDPKQVIVAVDRGETVWMRMSAAVALCLDPAVVTPDDAALQTWLDITNILWDAQRRTQGIASDRRGIEMVATAASPSSSPLYTILEAIRDRLLEHYHDIDNFPQQQQQQHGIPETALQIADVLVRQWQQLGNVDVDSDLALRDLWYDTIAAGHVHVLDYLYDHFSSIFFPLIAVPSKDYQSRTALHLAAHSGHVSVVQWILSVITKHVKQQDCATKNNNATVRQILQKIDANGQTARQVAAVHQNDVVVKLLDDAIAAISDE